MKLESSQNTCTEMIFVLDKSGSMHGLEGDVVKGFNNLIAKQREEEGSAVVTTVLFNTEEEFLHERVNLDDVPQLTRRQYNVGGCTALLDAVGSAIVRTKKAQKEMPKELRPKTIMVITTDGMENASTRFSAEQVRELIEKRQKKGWEFIFLGANIDAVQTASSFGIAEECACDFVADALGCEVMYEGLNCVLSAARREGDFSSEWKDSIARDYEKRG